MRDSFDHYFAGWSLWAEPSVEERTELAALVAAIGEALRTDADLAEAWRVHPFDGKKEAYLTFVGRYLARFGVQPAFAGVVARLQNAHGLSRG